MTSRTVEVKAAKGSTLTLADLQAFVDGLEQAGAGPSTPIGGVSGWRGLKSVRAQIAPEDQDPPRPGGGVLCPA